MCFLFRSPTFYDLSVFVKNGQLRSRKFLPRNIRFGNLHFRHIILHLDFLCFRRIFYCKSNTLRSYIAICRFCLRQSVLLSCNKFFNDMSLFPGSPWIYYLAIFIRHFQFRPFQFLSISQRSFCNLHNCWFIFKGKLIRQCFLICTIIFKSKLLYLIRCCESRCRGCFFDIVSVTNRKICRKCQFSLFVRSLLLNNGICFQNDITICIYNVLFIAKSEYCTFQYPVRILFFFQHLYFRFLTIILPVGRISYLGSILIPVCQVNLTSCTIQYIAVCRFLFFDIIFSKRNICQFCYSCFICRNRCYQIIFLVIIFTLTIRSFNIFQCINLKSNFFQGTGNIFK